LHALTFAAFLVLAGDAFHIGGPIADELMKLFERRISIGAVAFSLGSVFTFVLVILSSLLLSRVLLFILSASVYARIDLQRGSAESLSKIIHYAIVLTGFLLALGAAGLDLTKFTVLAGAFGVGLAFGMQNIVNNFVSGLILLFERPLHVGDNITVGATSGQVSDIGIRASTIRTWDGADVIMPNATLISNEVTNWTLSDVIRRCEMRVGVAYGTDPDRVIKLLKEIILGHPLILKTPAATAHLSGLGESSINFVARFWALVDQHVDVTSEVHVAVYRRLASEGIEIPFPQRDLNLRNVDPAVRNALVPKSDDRNA
jgi:small-conductance mechanosensitive channel